MLGRIMPTTMAQWTGWVVTALVTFGTDTDLLDAMLLGVCAGALATFCLSLSEARRTLAEG